MGSSLPSSGFGLRAERERRGLPPLPPELTMPAEKPAEKPEQAPVEQPAGRTILGNATVEISVTPVLDQDAMVKVCDQIAEQVADAFQRGFAAGIAETDAMVADSL